MILIGGGIMSMTLGVLLLELEPSWRVHIYERLPSAGEEASNEEGRSPPLCLIHHPCLCY